ncbi:hypothetical protein ACV1DR_08110, partial [Aeromonas jandaei]
TQSGLNQSKNRRLKTGLRDNYLEKRRVQTANERQLIRVGCQYQATKLRKLMSRATKRWGMKRTECKQTAPMWQCSAGIS